MWIQDQVPEAPRPRSHDSRGPSILVGHAVRAAEVFEKEVQLILCRLVGQLVETLLGGRGWLQTQRWIHESRTFICFNIGQMSRCILKGYEIRTPQINVWTFISYLVEAPHYHIHPLNERYRVGDVEEIDWVDKNIMDFWKPTRICPGLPNGYSDCKRISG